MRILVTGRDGQVSRCLADLADEGREIVCLGRPDLDLTERASIEAAIAAVRPDVVVNPAAYTAVDKAESEREAAFAVNATGAETVASAAAAAGIPIVHISTDYVFAGDKDGPYVETDETGPTGVYGASKLDGEKRVLAARQRGRAGRSGRLPALKRYRSPRILVDTKNPLHPERQQGCDERQVDAFSTGAEAVEMGIGQGRRREVFRRVEQRNDGW